MLQVNTNKEYFNQSVIIKMMQKAIKNKKFRILV